MHAVDEVKYLKKQLESDGEKSKPCSTGALTELKYISFY